MATSTNLCLALASGFLDCSPQLDQLGFGKAVGQKTRIGSECPAHRPSDVLLGALDCDALGSTSGLLGRGSCHGSQCPRSVCPSVMSGGQSPRG